MSEEFWYSFTVGLVFGLLLFNHPRLLYIGYDERKYKKAFFAVLLGHRK